MLNTKYILYIILQNFTWNHLFNEMKVNEILFFYVLYT